MEIIGEVRYIINDKYVLADIQKSFQKELKSGDTVEIIGKIPIDKEGQELVFSKGKLKILNQQPESKYYLLEAKMDTVRTPIFLSEIAQLNAFTYEKEVPASDAPVMNEKESLGLKVDRLVYVGDKIIKSEI